MCFDMRSVDHERVTETCRKSGGSDHTSCFSEVRESGSSEVREETSCFSEVRERALFIGTPMVRIGYITGVIKRSGLVPWEL